MINMTSRKNFDIKEHEYSLYHVKLYVLLPFSKIQGKNTLFFQCEMRGPVQPSLLEYDARNMCCVISLAT